MFIYSDSWREALASAETERWSLIATGDWSWVWASPDGSQVARVCPFDPAYRAFADFCTSSIDSRFLPTIDIVHDHARGGFTVMMETLTPTPPEAGRGFFENLETADPASELGRLRMAIESFHPGLPLWMGLDENPANVMQRPNGDLVLTDAFWINGPELYRLITASPAVALKLYPRRDLEHWAHLPCMTEEATALILERLMSV